jgi:hypothetical protein
MNAVYVDKTEWIFDLANRYKYIFLSRPRRFGKSLLSSTIDCYFRGRKDLFGGLAIEQLEKDWAEYPVFHFDLSTTKGKNRPETIAEICLQLENYEKMYGRNLQENTPGQRLNGLILRACEQTGRRVALIFDEYDAPLLDVIHEDEHAEEMRRVLQDFFSCLKKCDPQLRFVFITGVTKFSQLSIFSSINNLRNITMLPQYSTLCGITEEELLQYFGPEIQRLAQALQCEVPEAVNRLRNMYDGYHFSKDLRGVYNPFSLLNAFADSDLNDYWFKTGTPTFLLHQIKRFDADIARLDTDVYEESVFDQPISEMDTVWPLLYQSGYITIKSYDAQLRAYQLGIPNQEVRSGLMKSLLPMYAPVRSDESSNMMVRFCNAVQKEQMDEALEILRSFFASIPYPDVDSRVLNDPSHYEYYYSRLFYVLFSMFKARLDLEVHTARGRTDMVLFLNTVIYVVEFKVNASADEALAQIDSRGYTIPYEADGRKVVKVGVNFSSETRTIEEWKIIL